MHRNRLIGKKCAPNDQPPVDCVAKEIISNGLFKLISAPLLFFWPKDRKLMKFPVLNLFRTTDIYNEDIRESRMNEISQDKRYPDRIREEANRVAARADKIECAALVTGLIGCLAHIGLFLSVWDKFPNWTSSMTVTALICFSTIVVEMALYRNLQETLRTGKANIILMAQKIWRFENPLRTDIIQRISL